MNRIIIVLLIGILSGCASAPRYTEWGSKVHMTTTFEKFKQASVKALKDPGTWIPATGAVLVMASGNDEQWTQDALHNNPVYGSKKEAADASEDANNTLDVLWFGSTLVTDSNGSATDKVKGIFAQGVIINISNTATNIIKRQIDRREPDPDLRHVEHEGFPSNHSTPPFTRVALIRRNLEYTNANDVTKYAVMTGSYYLATVAAYGRVEAGLHHFSDQFAGAALGNYIGLVLYDMFFEEDSNWNMSVIPLNGGALAQFGYQF